VAEICAAADREAIIVEMVSLLLSSNTHPLQVVLGQLVPRPHPIFLGQAGKDRATRLKVLAAAQTIRPALPPLTNNIQVLAVVEEAAEARLTALPKEAHLTNNLRHHLHLPILHSRPSPPQTEQPLLLHQTSRLSENDDEKGILNE
jgi:hypothetical protein